jgi:hypothetical protein
MLLDLYFSPTTSQASHGEIFFFCLDDLVRCALLGKTIQGMDGGVFLAVVASATLLCSGFSAAE